jgi:hypothetical protein
MCHTHTNTHTHTLCWWSIVEPGREVFLSWNVSRHPLWTRDSILLTVKEKCWAQVILSVPAIRSEFGAEKQCTSNWHSLLFVYFAPIHTLLYTLELLQILRECKLIWLDFTTIRNKPLSFNGLSKIRFFS